MFASDGALAALLRESTALKDTGRMADSVDCLYQAKALMLVSPVIHTAESWCKLPLYLQQAGMYAESMTEFDFLLDTKNQQNYPALLHINSETIQVKRALARKRAGMSTDRPMVRCNPRKGIMLERRDQLLQNIDNRPLWQLRAACDGRDPPECPGINSPTYRWDNAFWETNAPWVCDKPDCRCAIRAYGLNEIAMTTL